METYLYYTHRVSSCFYFLIFFNNHSICIFTTQIVVLMIVVAAESAGLYNPATMGSKGAAVGRTKSDMNRDTSGDSFHLQSPDGQYVFGHTNGDQVRKL